jgi:hypothetical protein
MPDYTGPVEGAPQQPRSLKDTLAYQRDRLQHAQKWRKDQQHEDTWKRLIDLYLGKHFAEARVTGSREDHIAVNLCFSTINVIGPSIATNYPKITVNARAEENWAQAAIAEAVVNYWWRHYDLKPEFRRAVDDFLIVGHGWLKVGYRLKEVEAPRDPDDLADEFGELSAEADMFAAQRPDLAGDLPTDDEIRAAQPASETRVVEDRPFVERVSPFDMFVDPDATCIADAKWIAQRVIRPYEEAKRDVRYQPKARKSLKPDTVAQHPERDDADDGKHDVTAKVVLWEFYDLRAETLCVFPETGDDFLIKPQPMPYTYGHPYVMLRNYEVPDHFYPIGELEMLEPLQAELNKTRSQLASYRRKQARKYVGRKEAISEEGLRALASNEDNEVVWVQDDRPFDDVIAPIQQDNMDAQLYSYSEVIENDFDRISGVPEYMRGGLPEIRRTATEASIIQDSANARSADKLALVEDVIKEVAERLIQLAQQYLSTEQVVRVAGPDGQAVWVPFDREDIEGEFDFEVEAGSTQPRNETFRRQQAIQLMNTLGPLIGVVIDPAMIAQHVLREGFGIKNPERFMMQQMMIDPATGQPVPVPPEMAGQVPPQQGDAPPDQQVQPKPGTQAQLAGQVGLDLVNSQPPQGGGALGPGGY